MEGIFWLLLPIAAYSGWYAAMKQQKINSQKNYRNTPKKSKDYSEGIENFLAEQPDRAVDIVINKVDVTPETVEVHLALGTLYRRTGQVDRAIRLHQNLTEKLSLNPTQRELVLYELGQDYLSAGVYDRAERIFKDLLATKEFAANSLKALVEIYQKEKDWLQAIETLKIYESLTGKTKKPVISQYFCELAQKSLEDKDQDAAINFLNESLAIDKNCVRANLMRAEMLYGQESYSEALKYYFSILKQDKSFLSEIIEPVVNCLLAINQKNSLVSNIPSLLDQYFNVSDDFIISPPTEGADTNKKAIQFIEQQLEKNPSVKLLGQYMYLNIDNSNKPEKLILAKLKTIVNKIEKKEAGYRCNRCGFTSHNLHWHCPSCNDWNSIKPI